MNLSGKRILIVKPSSLGDVVHTLPLVHAIKRQYPTCHIGWVVQKSFKSLLESDPFIDALYPVLIPSTSDPSASWATFFRAAGATIRTLSSLRAVFRNRPYDLVLDLHASFRSGLLALTNPGGTRLGFSDAKEFNTFFQNHLVVGSPEKPHAVDKNLAFAQYLEISAVPWDFRVMIGNTEREKVQVFFKEAGIGPKDQVVYANPAARWKTKLWTVPAWAQLADLFADTGEARMIFGGGPGDILYVKSIAQRAHRGTIVAAGRLSLAESAALIEAADVYVGVDSGPMHIAAFVGTPVVAMFGPTDPAKVGPYGNGHRVIRNESLQCLGCRKRSCEDQRCLAEITARQVFDVTMEMLRGRIESI